MLPIRRSHLRRSFIRPKPREHAQPGGEYIFTYKGQEYRLKGRFVNDPVSPDGLRWYATWQSAKIIGRIVREIAENHCELLISPSCWEWLPYGRGHLHHAILKKMGGAFHEDRIWVNGERVRFLACPSCHREKHGKLYWTPKEKTE